MLVAVSTACFPELSFEEVLDKLADLEYAAVEIVVSKEGAQLTPEILKNDFNSIVLTTKRSVRRITPVAIYLDIEPTEPDFIEAFQLACFYANALQIVVITVRASFLGAPFNEEIERLRKLVKLGLGKGVIVGIQTESDRLSRDVDTVISLCNNVPGLAVTLDPSHFIFGYEKPKDYETLIEHVNHVRVRDTTKDAFQVQIGQGILEYGRLAITLGKVGFNRALCVDMKALPNLDFNAELRKMRLLLESIL